MTSQKLIAVHESSHCVVAYALCGWIPAHGSIEAKSDEGGVNICRGAMTAEEDAITTLAGPCGEFVYAAEHPCRGKGWGGDCAQVKRFTTDESEIRSLVARTCKILRDPVIKRAVLRLADVLNACGKLSREEVELILSKEIKSRFAA